MKCGCKFFKCMHVVCAILLFSITSSFGQYCGFQDVEPQVKMTHGEVWPKPLSQTNKGEYLKLEPSKFFWNVPGQTCFLLEEAIERYSAMLFAKAFHTPGHQRGNVNNHTVVGTLAKLCVVLETPCEEYPSLEMDEEYRICINKTCGVLSAYSIWGILRGLETFSQLVSLEEVDNYPTFLVRTTEIQDCPKYKYRGFLLDTARHFIPLPLIHQTLRAMSYSKLNVLHWHMVDDQSFSYQSSAFPDLSAKGAYGDSAVYTEREVKCVVEYARKRGIRVIPEFGTPGHTLSWGPGGIPGLLTECKSDPGSFGPIDPTKMENYEFLRTLLTEVNGLFPDKCLHLGGNTVNKTCWADNKKILDFMLHMNLCDFTKLQNFYFENLFNITCKLKNDPIVWQDLFDDHIRLPPNAIVQVWKDKCVDTIAEVLQSGHRVVVSSCWHMGCERNVSNWQKFYNCDLSEMSDRDDMVLGGESCLWGHFVDETNLLARSWPNLCAVAEALWSHEHNEIEAAGRLDEHVCRMRRRGIPAEPANGPHYCYY